MRTLILLALLLVAPAALANPGETACQRYMDALNNLANRTLTGPQATAAGDAMQHLIGGDPAATNAVKCQNALTYLHAVVRQAVVNKKRADQPPVDSSEVD